MSRARSLMIYLFFGRRWKLMPSTIPATLQRFAETEADSAWQLMQALPDVDDQHNRAELFANALEELGHADMFYKHAVKYSDRVLPLQRTSRHRMYSGRETFAQFRAELLVGESDVYEDFGAYIRACPLPDVKETLSAIRLEEEGHRNLGPHDLACDSRAMRSFMRRAQAGRLYRTWLRCGGYVGLAISGVLLTAVFLFFGFVLGPACRRRLAAPLRASHRADRGSPVFHQGGALG